MAGVTMPAALLCTPNQTDALLRELIGEVRGLHADLARDRRPVATLSRDDREILTRLLPAIAGALGSHPFTSRDLPDASPGVRVVLDGMSVKQIGQLLSRASVPIDGWIVERCGTEINVTLWRVLASVNKRLESGTALEHSGSIDRGEI